MMYVANSSLFLSKAGGQVGGWVEGILMNPGQAWNPQRLRGMYDEMFAFRHSGQVREGQEI